MIVFMFKHQQRKAHFHTFINILVLVLLIGKPSVSLTTTVGYFIKVHNILSSFIMLIKCHAFINFKICWNCLVYQDSMSLCPTSPDRVVITSFVSRHLHRIVREKKTNFHPQIIKKNSSTQCQWILSFY